MFTLRCQINGGILINRGVRKDSEILSRGVKVNRGVRIGVAALSDYTGMERTKAGCHKVEN